MKRIFAFLLALLTFCLCACAGAGNGAQTTGADTADGTSGQTTALGGGSPTDSAPSGEPANSQPSDKTPDASTDGAATASPSEDPRQVETDDDLHALYVERFRLGSMPLLLAFASEQLKNNMTEAGFLKMFTDLTDAFGAANAVKEENRGSTQGYQLYTDVFAFEGAELTATLTVKNKQIFGFTYNLRLTGEHTVRRPGYTELYFPLASGRYLLNAVYTVPDAENAPTVLLIPGSGPSDMNETLGALSPFSDLASGLAKAGVSSLRLEKRTFRYPDEFGCTDGVEEEYLTDLRAALEWLKAKNTPEIWLLGHSLGGQIAAELSKDAAVRGTVFWNSSLRHLAQIAADQYIAADPSGEETYRAYEKAAKDASGSGSGMYYFGASDAWWASYNALETAAAFASSDLPCLVLCSKADKQSFPADLELWQQALSGRENASLVVFGDQSHFGYRIDPDDPAAALKPAVFPQETVDAIAGFIKGQAI